MPVLLYGLECLSLPKADVKSLAPCGPRPGIHVPYPFISTPCTLSFSIFTFPFSLSYSLHLFSCFYIPSHSTTRIVPFCFNAVCYRRRLNLALVFLCVDIVLYIYAFLVKDACLFLSYLI